MSNIHNGVVYFYAERSFNTREILERKGITFLETDKKEKYI